MKNIDLTYLYNMYINEYEDGDYILNKEEFIATIEAIIEDLIREKKI